MKSWERFAMTGQSRLSRVGVLAVLLAIMALASGLAAQSPASWTAPRTAWGDPDLQGVWQTANTGTPMQRPTELGDRELLTSEEIAERVAALTDRPPPAESDDPEDPRSAAQAASARPSEQGIFGQEYNRFWVVADPRAVTPWNRTSLVIDPPNGRTPPITLATIERLEAREAARAHRGEGDSWMDRNVGERCIFPGNLRIGAGAFEILQSPGYVAIRLDIFNDNEPIVVPLDGRPRLGIRRWMGESRGHWEGQTLVVETTNFVGRLDGGPIMPKRTPFSRYLGTGETLSITERFTRVGPDMIEHRYTVEDPMVYVRPYTVLRPMTKEDDSFLMLESACHEGNYGIVGQLSAARTDEAYAMEAAREEAATRGPQLQEMKRATEEWMRTHGGSRP